MQGLTTVRAGSTLVITLARPDVCNALDGAVIEALRDAFELLDADAALRVGILTGAGGHFCAGMDLKAFMAGEMGDEQERAFGALVERPAGKPLVAAVEGAAIGGGWELAISCDLVVASGDASFGLPEVARGIVPMGGSLLRLPRRIPYQVAMELVLTGARIDAARAHALGAVNRITSPGGALAEAHELAHEIAANAPIAVAGVKRVMRASADAVDAMQWRDLRAAGRAAYASADAQEGARAFLERRPPRWSGR
jgi:enoyl-CoA hydratase